MQKLSGRIAAVLVTGALAVAAAGAPAGAATRHDGRHGPRVAERAAHSRLGVVVDHRTSAVFQQDPGPFGDGPTENTVLVGAHVRGCPVGEYSLSGTLSQGGVSFPVATGGALGFGEFTCETAGTSVDLPYAFYGPQLHAGLALAHFEVYSFEAGGVIARTTRLVHIPRQPR